MDSSAVEDARLVALACGAFLAWHVTAWVVARGRWSRRRESGFSDDPPAFMARTVELLTDLLILAALGLPAVFGVAALLYALVWIAIPLGRVHGWPVGAAGSAVTFFALAITSIRVQQCMGQRLRSLRTNRQ